MPNLTDKIVVITGASRGIGKAILQRIAAQGARIIGTATSETGVAMIEQHLQECKAQGQGYVLDVSKSDSIEAFADALADKELMPDILINNAGITRDNLLLRMKDSEWDDVIQTNLSGIFRLTRASLKNMIRKRWGRIINISSVVAFSGNPGQANYCAAKAGIIGFTKSLAIELASRSITVNAVAPGFIETDMTKEIDEKYQELLLNQIPLRRIGQANEVAAAVEFLASPSAAYITGQTLHVNGGMYLA